MKKTVLVTGSSRGIGKAIAELFAKKGMNIVFNYYVNKEKTQDIVHELNKKNIKSMALKADVSNKYAVDKMIKKIDEIFGSIDILVNNAGIAQQKMFRDITEDEWDKMFDVNVKGMYNCIQAVLPSMVNNKRGKIINISSIWGITGASCEVHYSASKAAVIGLTKALAKELGPSNIQVNCVAPGVVKTDMISDFSAQDIEDLKNETPLGVIGLPTDIAKIVHFLASEDANFITGQVISPNGGFVI